MEQINSSNLRYLKAKEEDRQKISMIDIIMIREIIRIGIDQIVKIEEFHLVVEFSVDKIIRITQDINIVIGTILEEEI